MTSDNTSDMMLHARKCTTVILEQRKKKITVKQLFKDSKIFFLKDVLFKTLTDKGELFFNYNK